MNVNRRACTFLTEVLLPTHKDCNTSLFEPRGRTGLERVGFPQCQAMCTAENASQCHGTSQEELLLRVQSAVYGKKSGADRLHSDLEAGWLLFVGKRRGRMASLLSEE